MARRVINNYMKILSKKADWSDLYLVKDANIKEEYVNSQH
jgi:hypothetical protein